MVEFRVDLVISGHHHSYQRSCRVVRGVCTDDAPAGARGPVYLVAGMAGKVNVPIVPRPGPHPYGDIWQVVDVENHGYGVVGANQTHLEWEYRKNGGGIADRFVLEK